MGLGVGLGVGLSSASRYHFIFEWKFFKLWLKIETTTTIGTTTTTTTSFQQYNENCTSNASCATLSQYGLVCINNTCTCNSLSYYSGSNCGTTPSEFLFKKKKI